MLLLLQSLNNINLISKLKFSVIISSVRTNIENSALFEEVDFRANQLISQSMN